MTVQWTTRLDRSEVPFPSRKPIDSILPERRNALRLLAAYPFLLAGCGGDEERTALSRGRPLPILRLPDLEGKTIELGGGGPPSLLNFWATWCPPCRAEMASLDRLYRIVRRQGILFYGISVDDDANLLREFVLRQGISFSILHDRAGALTLGQLGLHSFPTTVLVNRDGRVAEVVLGDRRWDEDPEKGLVEALREIP